VVRDRLEEILQAAEEIETVSMAALDECEFTDEDERLSYIRTQATEIIEKVSALLGY